MSLEGGKYKIRKLQVHVVDHCNLSCAGCSHGSPFAPKKFYRWADYAPWVEQLSAYAYTTTIDLTGGECFLNPHLAELVKGFKQCVWKPIVCVATNAFWIDNYDKYADVLTGIDTMFVTAHPPLGKTKADLNRLLAPIGKKYNFKFLVVAHDFVQISLRSTPKKRTYCKFCPQLLANGQVAKCQIIAYQQWLPEMTKAFMTRSSQGLYDITTGNYKTMYKWYTGGKYKNGLHKVCDYCDFNPGDDNWAHQDRHGHSPLTKSQKDIVKQKFIQIGEKRNKKRNK